MKAPVPLEHQEQSMFVRWLRFNGIKFFSTVQGARVRWSQANKLKREGMQAGVPDIILIDRHPTTGQPIAIEMKRKKGGVLSQAQKDMHDDMRARDWYLIVAHGCEDAISQTEVTGLDKHRTVQK